MTIRGKQKTSNILGALHGFSANPNPTASHTCRCPRPAVGLPSASRSHLLVSPSSPRTLEPGPSAVPRCGGAHARSPLRGCPPATIPPWWMTKGWQVGWDHTAGQHLCLQGHTGVQGSPCKDCYLEILQFTLLWEFLLWDWPSIYPSSLPTASWITILGETTILNSSNSRILSLVSIFKLNIHSPTKEWGHSSSSNSRLKLPLNVFRKGWSGDFSLRLLNLAALIKTN